MEKLKRRQTWLPVKVPRSCFGVDVVVSLKGFNLNVCRVLVWTVNFVVVFVLKIFGNKTAVCVFRVN